MGSFDEAFEKRLAEGDRLLGIVAHDLGNVLLPSRRGVDDDDSPMGRDLRLLRRSASIMVDHVRGIRCALEHLRGIGRDDRPVVLSEWWPYIGGLLRSNLRMRPPMKLGGADPAQVRVRPEALGRLLHLALIAVDEQVELREPLAILVDLEETAAAPAMLRVATAEARTNESIRVPAALRRFAAENDVALPPSASGGGDLLAFGLPAWIVSPRAAASSG